jgi:hypothetical protein
MDPFDVTQIHGRLMRHNRYDLKEMVSRNFGENSIIAAAQWLKRWKPQPSCTKTFCIEIPRR